MKKAVALAYTKNQDRSPRVIAKGRGELAQQILSKAKKFDVPIFYNQALVDSLLNLRVETQIPNALLQAVAEVFVWLWEIEKKSQLS